MKNLIIQNLILADGLDKIWKFQSSHHVFSVLNQWKCGMSIQSDALCWCCKEAACLSIIYQLVKDLFISNFGLLSVHRAPFPSKCLLQCTRPQWVKKSAGWLCKTKGLSLTSHLRLWYWTFFAALSVFALSSHRCGVVVGETNIQTMGCTYLRGHVPHNEPLNVWSINLLSIELDNTLTLPSNSSTSVAPV